MDNRHGLIVNARVTRADGHTERQAALSMVSDARQIDPQATITLGADKGYDTREFVQDLRELRVVPHVAQNKSRRR